MDKNYDLEIAYRKMSELHKQAEHDAVVKELKEEKRKHSISFWRKIFGQRMIKSAKPIKQTES